MAQPDFTSYPSGQVRCSYHPDELTGLRCSRCGKPICPKCAVRTPVGLRCPDCAGVRGLPTYRTPTNDLARALAAGTGIAVGVALLWRFIPTWQFYLCLLLGFGVVEAMARLTGNKRGADLQLAAMAAITLGFLLSRVLLAQRFGVTLDQVNAMSDQLISPEIIETFRRPVSIAELLQLRLIPDLLFAAFPYLIAYVRFR